MKLFKRPKKKSYTIITGCGRLGASLATTLSDSGEDVLIIDRKEESFNKLPASFGGITMVGDAVKLFLEGECDIDTATTVIAVTNQDNTNIMVAQIAKEMYNPQHVIARLYDPERECVYQELGIDTICPVVLSTNAVYNLLHEGEEDAQTDVRTGAGTAFHEMAVM